MSHTTAHYRDGAERMDGMYFMRDALDCEHVGVTMIDADDEFTGPEHDHADEGHEEVYLVVDGSAVITVDGHDHEIHEGEAVRVSPDATRQLRVHAGGRAVVCGAP